LAIFRSRTRLPALGLAFAALLGPGCKRQSAAEQAPAARSVDAASRSDGEDASAAVEAVSERATEARRIEIKDVAMGTSVTFVAYTNDRVGEPAARDLVARALREIRRLESLLSEWRDDSEITRVNRAGGEWVEVAPETLEVLERGVAAGKLSEGTFDITFEVMSDVWKFGDARDAEPAIPKRTDVLARKKLVDYRRVELGPGKVRIGKGQKLGLGGIAKGYIVDKAAKLLAAGGLGSYLVQAGGDLYGSGRKPDGSRWVSGIQDPRGTQGKFFGVIELEDHAFSTAGDYARSYLVDGKRYHHIIDPRTGYPATACRSVTVWAPDALTADTVDDAVFILGPQKGLALVESLDGVGVVIVDAKNEVWVSKRLEGIWKQLSPPTDGI
jgi:thiamine biosynthesis lipoprotein